jgi:hypothetical protein
MEYNQDVHVEIRPDDEPDTVLRLSYAPGHNGLDALHVEVEADGLTVNAGGLTLRGDGFDHFLTELANDWRGWEGVRRWESLERDVSVEATHEGRRVELVFVLRRDYTSDAWEVRLPILVAGGESLSAIARRVTRLLA